VQLYKIDAPASEGGGHVWPKSPDLAATDLVLDFFSRH
jgi:hypothetical protein